MTPEIRKLVDEPGRLDADMALALIRVQSKRKRSFRLWTPSRLLQRLGVPWHLPEYRPLLHRLDHVMRDLEARGALSRRARWQTSRNMRVEWAYVLSEESPQADRTQPASPGEAEA